MNKQLFIAMCLTSELKAVINYYENGKVTSQINKSVTGYSTEKIEDFEYLIKVGYGTNIEFRKEISVLPILHPLSDLTKEIECKGEKFVPIVELAKIAGLFGSKIKLNNFFNERWKIGFKFQNEEEYFYLNDHELEFNYIKNNNEYPIRHQFQLFQKLIEWHFDIAGLIEKGEAIDINTLGANPYKLKQIN